MLSPSITKPDPEAKGAARAIQWALREARTDPSDVDYINAHGTGTRLNDLMETAAVKRVFGEAAKALPLSSIKSMVGHLIGATGAVEAVALALTLHQGVLPPIINQTHPDPECDLDSGAPHPGQSSQALSMAQNVQSPLNLACFVFNSPARRIATRWLPRLLWCPFSPR